MLRASTSGSDVPARYGGEEFAVIFPGTSVEEAAPRAEAIRREIESSVFQHEGVDLRVTGSIGLAQLQQGEDIDSLIKRADEALYASKEAGRNCGHWHDGQVIHPVAASQRSSVSSDSRALPTADDTSKKPDSATADTVKSSTVPQPPTQPHSPSKESTAASKGPDLPSLKGVVDWQEFEDEMTFQVGQWNADGGKLSALLISIDDYERLASETDSTGHAVLSAAAQFVKAAVRNSHVVSRYDSRSFAVLMTDADLAKAAQIGERVRRAISRCVLPVTQDGLRFTVSVGAAEFGCQDNTETLLQRTQSALEAAAAEVGNRTCCHDGQQCSFVGGDQPALAATH